MDGKKEGKGELIFIDESRYNGEFENNLINGYGSY